MRVLRTSISVPRLAVVMKPCSNGKSELESRASERRNVKYDTLELEYAAVRS